MVIRDRDSIKIADKIFKVAIRYDDADQNADQNAAEAAADVITLQYAVECPKCGAVYDVSGPDERVGECADCDDYDRYEIAKTGARAM